MALELLSFYKFWYFHSNRNSIVNNSLLMFCDPNGGSISHYPLHVIASSSFVVEFHYLFPIVVECTRVVVDVDPKGKN
jgi:hypothetical protein